MQGMLQLGEYKRYLTITVRSSRIQASQRNRYRKEARPVPAFLGKM